MFICTPPCMQNVTGVKPDKLVSWNLKASLLSSTYSHHMITIGSIKSRALCMHVPGLDMEYGMACGVKAGIRRQEILLFKQMVLSIKLMLRYIIFPRANLSTCILAHAIKLFSNSNNGILDLDYTEIHNWVIYKERT